MRFRNSLTMTSSRSIRSCCDSSARSRSSFAASRNAICLEFSDDLCRFLIIHYVVFSVIGTALYHDTPYHKLTGEVKHPKETMKKKIKGNAVYSTDQGRLCPQCHRAVTGCVCGSYRPSHVGDGIVRISRETKGRGGKAVTVINGLPVPPTELSYLQNA